MSWEERRKIIERIREVLESLDFVEYAIVYGGFVGSKYFRDIDIGIFVSKDKPSLDEELQYAFKVEEALRKKLKLQIPFDVRVLNNAPKEFVENILENHIVVKSNKKNKCKLKAQT